MKPRKRCEIVRYSAWLGSSVAEVQVLSSGFQPAVVETEEVR